MWSKILLLLLVPAIAFASLPPTRIQDEGSDLGVVFNFNCTGGGISCVRTGILATLNVIGGGGSGSEVNNLETITTGIATTEIPIGTAADTVVYAPMSSEATMDNAGAVTVAATHSGSAHHAAATVTDTTTINMTLTGQDIKGDSLHTAGDALTLTGADFDFDGGAAPGGELGGADWSSPTVDATHSGSAHHAADGVGYDEILDETSGLTKRAQVNFTGAGVSCVDNGGATRTDCTIAGGASQNIWATFTAQSGSTTADSTTDTLDVAVLSGITATISGDTLTIGNDVATTGLTNRVDMPVFSAKLTGAYVTTAHTGVSAAASAAIDAGNGEWRLLFDDTIEEAAVWGFRMPPDYSSGLTAKLIYTMVSATADDVEWEVSVMAVSDGESTAVSFDSVNVGTETVPGTAGLTSEISITLTNDDSAVAGDFVYIYVSLDSDDAANDDATGDRELLQLQIEYSSSDNASDTNALKMLSWGGSDTIPLKPSAAAFDGVAPLSLDTGTNQNIYAASFDDTADECRGVTFKVPEDINTAGTAQFHISWYSKTATANSVAWFIAWHEINEGESWDSTTTTDFAASDAVQGTVDLITETTWTETLANLGWTSDESINAYFCRDGDGTNATDDLVGDAEAIIFGIELPRK